MLHTLEGRGWQIKRSAQSNLLLPDTIQHCYPQLPKEISEFICSLELCTNSEQTVWLMCCKDYVITSEKTFERNFCELLSLKSAEGDIELQENIHKFWDLHFPFMLAVHSDYDYLAVSLSEDSFGEIVHGSAPEFEEVSFVAASFTEFLTMFKVAAEKGETDYPLSLFSL